MERTFLTLFTLPHNLIKEKVTELTEQTINREGSLYYPHAFLKNRRGYCNRLRPSVRPSVCPSVCPSVHLLLNHWTKSNQILCVSWSHEWGVQRHIFFGPAPWGPGEGPKGQISLNIIKFQLQSQFQRFFNQTVCVFSHMKDIKHIRRDFH